MIQIKVSGELDSNAIKKLVKAFYRTEDVIVTDDDKISNTVKRKLVNDRVTQFISFNFFENNNYERKCKEEKKKKEEISIPINKNGCRGKIIIDFCDGERNFIKQKISDEVILDDKADIDRRLYNILCEHTGMELSWGTMNGVHPVKYLLSEFMSGADEESIHKANREYKERYLINDRKSRLIYDIAKTEYDVVSKHSTKDRYSLYVGIPFCPSTCIYCSFASFSMDRFAHLVDDYLEALKHEIAMTALQMREFNNSSPLTVYIGGGTPTSLTASQMDDLLTTISKEFDLSGTVEFTVEAGRPDSIDIDKLKVMRKNGVTRISINPQTMKEHTLGIIGRHHTTQEIVDVYKLARNIGFDNINMDLIMGLPGENESDAKNTLEQIIKLNPENVTVHTLAIKRGAKLGINLRDYEADIEQNVARMVDMSFDMLKNADYKPYYLYRQKNMADGLENTGYTKEGFECIYNIVTMEELQTIVACGAGTVTKRVYGNGRIERCDNVKDVNLYISKINEMINRKRSLFID